MRLRIESPACRFTIGLAVALAVNGVFLVLLPILNRLGGLQAQPRYTVREFGVADAAKDEEKPEVEDEALAEAEDENLPEMLAALEFPPPALPALDLDPGFAPLAPGSIAVSDLAIPGAAGDELPLRASLQAPASPTMPGADGLGTFDASALSRPPVAVFRPAPAYPPTARRLGMSGSFPISFVVTVDGRSADLRILGRPEGCGAVFDSSIIETVSSWLFTPGELNGTKVPSRVTTTIIFQLE